MAKKNQLVYVVTYNFEVLEVCSSRSTARKYCKQAVLDLDMHVDLFKIIELPVVTKM